MGHGEAVRSEWLYAALVARVNSLDGKGILTELNGMVFDRGFEAITTAASWASTQPTATCTSRTPDIRRL